MLNQFDENP